MFTQDALYPLNTNRWNGCHDGQLRPRWDFVLQTNQEIIVRRRIAKKGYQSCTNGAELRLWQVCCSRCLCAVGRLPGFWESWKSPTSWSHGSGWWMCFKGWRERAMGDMRLGSLFKCSKGPNLWLRLVERCRVRKQWDALHSTLLRQLFPVYMIHHIWNMFNDLPQHKLMKRLWLDLDHENSMAGFFRPVRRCSFLWTLGGCNDYWLVFRPKSIRWKAQFGWKRFERGMLADCYHKSVVSDYPRHMQRMTLRYRWRIMQGTRESFQVWASQLHVNCAEIGNDKHDVPNVAVLSRTIPKFNDVHGLHGNEAPEVKLLYC